MNPRQNKLTSLVLNRRLVIPAFLSVLLVVVSQYSFLLFHTLAEFFAIVVALILSVVVWHTHSITRNHFLAYLGCGYLWVAALDMIHTLAYKGMNILPFVSANESAQLWISGRYLEAFLLLSAPFFLSHSLARNKAFFAFGSVAIVSVVLIATGNFPDAFIEGRGLTPFKIYSEYVIIAILLLAIVFFLDRREKFDNRVLVLMIASICLTIGAELAFTYYVSVFGLSNLVGHIFKIFSYWLIFEAIVHTTLSEPYKFKSEGADTYEAIPYPTILIGPTGSIHQVNKAACEVANRTIDQLIGRNCHDIFHRTGKSAQDCNICQAISRNLALPSTRLHIPEGNEHWELSLSPVDPSNKSAGMIHLARNITKRVRMEESLNENEELFEIITETSPVGISITSIEDSRFLFCNKKLGDLIGAPPEELIGKKASDFYADSQDRRDLIGEIKHTGFVNNFEIPTVTMSGENRWAMVSCRQMEFDGERALLTATTDITEKRTNEDKVVQNAKLATLGEMSAGIAHELNQPLSIIRMTAENILAGMEKGTYGPDKTAAKLNTLTDQVDRMAGIINHMRLFSRKDSDQNELFDPRTIVSDAVGLIDEQFKILSIDVSTRLPDACQQIIGHPLQLEQLVVNLLNNSRDAIVERLAQSNSRIPDYFPCIEVLISDKPDEKVVLISIIDNGGGIPEDVIEHVLDPFFTTKPSGKGTGLGLSIAFDIVDRMNGKIKFQNEGDGCRVDISLPGTKASRDTTRTENSMTNEDSTSNENNSPVTPDETMNEIRILIADDEPLAAESVSEYLKYKGFTVILASNGEDALDLFLAQPIDAIVTDLRMPVMDGNELIKNVRSHNQNIPIIVTTGHASVGDDEDVVTEGATTIMKKPIELSKLAGLLDEMTRPRSRSGTPSDERVISGFPKSL